MPSKGSARQRLHPGSDSRIKLWDLESGYNTLVNCEMVHLQTSKAIQLAVSQDAAHVLVPCMTVVKVKYSFYVIIVFDFVHLMFGLVKCPLHFMVCELLLV